VARGSWTRRVRGLGDPAGRNQAGRAPYDFYVGTLYRNRLFNADPHPGNLLFHAGGAVTILDYGCVREFDPRAVAALAGAHPVRAGVTLDLRNVVRDKRAALRLQVPASCSFSSASASACTPSFREFTPRWTGRLSRAISPTRRSGRCCPGDHRDCTTDFCGRSSTES
jgi:hypothetical protein